MVRRTLSTANRIRQEDGPLLKCSSSKKDVTLIDDLVCGARKGRMSVAELLINLRELQVIDAEIFDLKKQIAEIPVKLKSLDAELESAASKVKKEEEELKRLQLERKNKEMDLGEKENTIKKYQAQLYQVKTNAEYTALEKEIGGLRADNSVLEEGILEILDEIEAAEKKVAEEKRCWRKKRKR